MAASTTQLMDFTLGFAEADRPWADWIIWVLESEGYTIEQKAEEAAFQLRIDEIQGQHYIPIWSQQYLRAQNLLLQTAQIVINYDLGQKKQVLPIQIDQSDSFPEPDLITPLNLGEGDRATAKQRLLEGARSLPLPFQPPPKPPFRKPAPPFPGQSRQQGWIQTKERRSAQGYIEKLGDSLQLEMMQIPGGTFMMGQTDVEREQLIRDTDEKTYQEYFARELPRHSVTVSGFAMARYPVTQAQWRFVAGLEAVDRTLKPDPSKFKGDDLPVESISWHEAMEFCARLSRYTCRGYSLPTEAEWEYACRGKTETPFHFGEIINPAIANYNGNYIYGHGQQGLYRKQTTSVGSFQIANAFGLYDMHGNVWEWCMDHWNHNYEGSSNDGSMRLDSRISEDAPRVLRGGSWDFYPWLCRSASRFKLGSNSCDDFVGLRVVLRIGRFSWSSFEPVFVRRFSNNFKTPPNRFKDYVEQILKSKKK